MRQLRGSRASELSRKTRRPRRAVNRCEQQGRERKVTRSIGSGYGYGYGYDGQMSDPQGMPLTGNAPWGWGTTGHAANRHCPLEPAPAPVTSPPSVEWKEPSGSAESVCVYLY